MKPPYMRIRIHNIVTDTVWYTAPRKIDGENNQEAWKDFLKTVTESISKKELNHLELTDHHGMTMYFPIEVLKNCVFYLDTIEE